MAIRVSSGSSSALVVNQGNRPEAAVVVKQQTVTGGSSGSGNALSRTNVLRVNAGSRTESAVVVKKLDGTLTVQGLSNVDSANLQDGYTIIYDAETNTWITQEIVATAVASIDGGYY